MALSNDQKRLADLAYQKATRDIAEIFKQKLEEVKRELSSQNVQPGQNRFRIPVSQVMGNFVVARLRARADCFFRVIDEYSVEFDDAAAADVLEAVNNEATRLKKETQQSSLSDSLGIYETLLLTALDSALHGINNDIEIRRTTLKLRSKSLPPSPITNIHVFGANARVNVGSIDNSTNMVHGDERAGDPFTIFVIGTMFKASRDIEPQIAITIQLRFSISYRGPKSTLAVRQIELDDSELNAVGFYPFFNGPGENKGVRFQLEPGYSGEVTCSLSGTLITSIDNVASEITGNIFLTDTYAGDLPKISFKAAREE